MAKKEVEKKKNGRPYTKFCPEIVNAILADMEAFVPQDIACRAHGLSPRSFLSWRTQGEEELDRDEETDFTRLLRAVEQIRSNHIKYHVSNIIETPQGHKGSEWILRRAYWKYFSDKAEVLELEDRISSLEKEKKDNKIKK